MQLTATKFEAIRTKFMQLLFGLQIMQKTIKLVVGIFIMLLLAVGSHWYYSPYLSMNSMAKAAKAKDASKFNEYVDYPSLRESIKGQFSVKMAEVIGSQPQNAFSALGTMIGVTMVNQMVDAFLRPEMVMKMMEHGKAQIQNQSSNSKPFVDDTNSQPLKWEFDRQGTDLILATVINQDPQNSKPVFVFQRTGYANWRLTEIRLPALK